MVKTKKGYECSECGKEMKNARSLAGHMWFAHNIRYGEKHNLRREIKKLENEPRITDDTSEKIVEITEKLDEINEKIDELKDEKLPLLLDLMKDLTTADNPGNPGDPHNPEPKKEKKPEKKKSGWFLFGDDDDEEKSEKTDETDDDDSPFL